MVPERRRVFLSRISNLEEIGHPDTEYCSIEVDCAVCIGAILPLLAPLSLFYVCTHLSILRLSAGIKGVLYNNTVYIPLALELQMSYFQYSGILSFSISLVFHLLINSLPNVIDACIGSHLKNKS